MLNWIKAHPILSLLVLFAALVLFAPAVVVAAAWLLALRARIIHKGGRSSSTSSADATVYGSEPEYDDSGAEDDDGSDLV